MRAQQFDAPKFPFFIVFWNFLGDKTCKFWVGNISEIFWIFPKIYLQDFKTLLIRSLKFRSKKSLFQFFLFFIIMKFRPLNQNKPFRFQYKLPRYEHFKNQHFPVCFILFDKIQIRRKKHSATRVILNNS